MVEGKAAVGCYLDCGGAFDSGKHGLLLHKLGAFEITQGLQQDVKDFPGDKFSVRVSNKGSVHSGLF